MQAEKSEREEKGLTARPALKCHEDEDEDEEDEHVSAVHPEHSAADELSAPESEGTGREALFPLR